MNKRHHKDWIKAYLEYTEETESPVMFHKWTAVSVIASVLQKKVNFKAGRIDGYPNLYIIFVGPPGSRKSQAIKFGEEILTATEIANISADSITREKLIKNMAGASFMSVLPNNKEFTHSSLTIVSKEFETFLGQKTDNTKMIVLLTDLFDCPNGAWKYETKGSGSDIITEPWLNLIGATTPHSLSSSLPASAIGGGLTTRILFIYERKRNKRIAIPEFTDEIKELKNTLIEDLIVIGRIAGDYEFAPGTKHKYIHWYNELDDNITSRICKDGLFDGWYERKSVFIRKLACIVAASSHSDLIITWEDFERSIEMIEEVEKNMSGAFAAVGKSDITAEVEEVMNYIRSRKWIRERDLKRLTYRDIDANKFDNVIKTVIGGNWAVRRYSGPNEEKTTWYVWTDSLEDWKKAGGGDV